MIKYQVVRIRSNEVTTQENSFPPWEVPILKALHGEAAVTVLDEEVVDRAMPTAEDEYKRLADRYSRHKEEGNAVVAQVYGLFEAGIEKLEKEMKGAETDEDVPDHAAAAESGKDERLKALKEKQKAEADAFKAKQAEELKQAERDAESRIKQAEQRNKDEEEQRERDELARADQRLIAASRVQQQPGQRPLRAHDAKQGEKGSEKSDAKK
jgi:hypothetical protein